MKHSFIVFALLLVQMCGISAQETEEADIPKPDYTYFLIGGGQWSDSLTQGNAFGGVFGYNLISDKIALDWQLRGLARWATFKARRDNPRVFATPLVQAMLGAIPAWTGVICKEEKFFIHTIIPLLQLPFGSHLAFRPVSDLTFYAGVTPELLLFTDDDGMLLQYRIGTRLVLSALAFELEAVKSEFSAWDQESRSFGWGFGLNLLIDFPEQETSDL